MKLIIGVTVGFVVLIVGVIGLVAVLGVANIPWEPIGPELDD